MTSDHVLSQRWNVPIAFTTFLLLALVFPRSVVGQCEPLFIDSRPVSMAGGTEGPGLSASQGRIAVSSLHGQPGDSGPGVVTIFNATVEGLTDDSMIDDPAALELGYFGWDCSLSGNRLAVAAGSDSPFQAYVFDRVGDSWLLTASLRPDAPAFGHSVALDGEVLLLGSSGDSRKASGAGAAYIFRRGFDGVWRQEATIFAPDQKKGAYFGSSVALSGNVALIGADGDDTVCDGCGAAYLFRFNGVSWAFEQKLLPDSPANFGFAVAIEGGTAVISNSPGIHVYAYDGATWGREAVLEADEGGHLGGAAIENAVIAGADTGDSTMGRDSGAVYVFRKAGGSWGLAAKLFSPDPAESEFFGYPVAIGGGFLAAADRSVSFKGQIDAWRISCCPPDCDANGVLNINDFLCFQAEWRKKSAYGDYNADGKWNINDFIAFQADWRKGCP